MSQTQSFNEAVEEILEKHLPSKIYNYSDIPHKLQSAIIKAVKDRLPEKHKTPWPEGGSHLKDYGWNGYADQLHQNMFGDKDG